MRTEGLKGVLLSTLVIASMVALAILSLSISSCDIRVPQDYSLKLSNQGGLYLSIPSVPSEYENISPEEAIEMIDSRQNIIIVDVRTPAEYELGHIPGAVSLPLQELEETTPDFDKTKDIIVYCGSGVRSKEASKILLGRGFDRVYNLLGGLSAWTEVGFQVADNQCIGCNCPFNNSDEIDREGNRCGYRNYASLRGYTPLPEWMKPDPVKEMEWLSYLQLPSQFDWRNYNGQDWTTPAKNQGNCGSCWDFAGHGALEAVINIEEGDATLDLDLSEQYALSCLPESGSCSGGNAITLFYYLKDETSDGNNANGAIPESCFPYQADDTVPCSSKCSDWQDKLEPILDWGFWIEPGRDFIKNKLVEYGPLVTAIAAMDDLWSWGNTHHGPDDIYEHAGSESVSDINHQVVIVGYNDSQNCWIVKNSWGTSWAYNGFFKIVYGDCQIETEIGYVTVDLDAPPPPALGLPANNAVNYFNYLRFSWENLDPVENTVPVTYHVQVDNNSDFSSPENENYWQPDNSFETNLQDGFWYWRVRARDNAGNVGEWSEVRIVLIKISGTRWGSQADWEAGTYENACVHNGSVSVGLYPPVPYFNCMGWDNETHIYEEVDILEATCKEGKAYFFAQDDSGLGGESGSAYAYLENTFYLDSAGVENKTLGFWWEAWSDDFNQGSGFTYLKIKIKKPDNSWVDLWSKTYYTPWGNTESGRATVNVPSNILEESGLYTIRIYVYWYFDVTGWFDTERFRWRVDNLSFGLTKAKHTTQWHDVGAKSAWQILQAGSDIGAGEIITARVEVSNDGENVDDYSEAKNLANGISTYDISGLQDGRYVRIVTYLMTSSLDHTPKLNEYVVTSIPILETILIEGNDNFTASNGVISGSGTLEDLYIIENWIISAENAHGIWIRNTTAYFIIRNCLVENGDIHWHDGIHLDNVVNGRIENNTCENNRHGIYLSYSSNNTLTDSAIKGNERGVQFSNSNNNNVENCVIENNKWRGIALEESVNNTITNCVVENSFRGIELYWSDNNTIADCVVENNYNQCGILIANASDNNVIENNNSSNNTRGIYIADSLEITIKNNVFENDGIFIWGENVYHFNTHVIENNIVNGRPVYYYADISGIEVPDDAGGVILANCSNMIVRNLEISNSTVGIELAYTQDSQITNNLLSHSLGAIYLMYSDNNIITQNNASNNGDGIELWRNSDNNTVKNNVLSNNGCGIELWENSDNNLIYHNNIVNNATQAYDECSNFWDDGYPSGGNYWSDYTGTDENQGENQEILGSDGIGDTPYYIPGDNNRDRYPFMDLWRPAAWQLIEMWSGTIQAPLAWQVIETWTGTIQTPAEWQLIETWTGTIETPSWTGTAVFSLVNLYTVNVEKILDLNQGSKLVVKFYDYSDAYENENVVENFTTPPTWHVEENESARHPEGTGVRKARLDLTTDDTSNVISTIASFIVRKVDLEARFMDISFYWSMADPAGKLELETEFMEIPFYWSGAPD